MDNRPDIMVLDRKFNNMFVVYDSIPNETSMLDMYREKLN